MLNLLMRHPVKPLVKFKNFIIPKMGLRPLTGQDGDALRAVRLEALTFDPSVFAASFKEEWALTAPQWRERAAQTSDGCWIGVFSGDDLIGLTQATTWDYDISGQSVVFRSSYLKPEYRRQGAARLMSEARQEWARAQSKYKSIWLFHRKGHWIKKCVNDFGAVYSHTALMRFADGLTSQALWYHKPIQ